MVHPKNGIGDQIIWEEGVLIMNFKLSKYMLFVFVAEIIMSYIWSNEVFNIVIVVLGLLVLSSLNNCLWRARAIIYEVEVWSTKRCTSMLRLDTFSV